MKNSPPPHGRFVRCPKCREILPEPADVPFYRCGRCETILQAKYYKKENQTREIVSEGSSSGQNNQGEDHSHGGEASSSNSPISVDSSEGINQIDPQNGNLEQPRVSNSSREASISSEPKQQPLPSSDQHFRDRDEETDQNANLQVRKDSSLNEPSPPNHQLPVHSVPVITGEVEGESVKQRGDIGASSSIELMEQPTQIALENGEIRQDVIVVEEQLEAVDSSSESAASETNIAKNDGEADELMIQNVSVNRILEQPGVVASFSSAVLLSTEFILHETNSLSQIVVEEGAVEGSNRKVQEQLQVSNSVGESTLPSEPEVGRDELSSQLGSPNEEVTMTEQHFVANPRERQPVSQVKYECEVSSTNEPVSILQGDGLSQFITKNEKEAGANVDENCGTDGDIHSNTVTSLNESRFSKNKELSRLVTENQETITVQNEFGTSNEDQLVDNLPGEIISAAGINSKVTEESAFVLPEAERTSVSNLPFQSAPDETRERELQHSVIGDEPADGNNKDHAVTSTMGAEIVNLDDRSQKTVDTSPREKIQVPHKARETRKIVEACLEAGTSYKSPTRSSFAYDGSVSSYGENDDKVTYQIPSGTMNKTENPGAEDQRQYHSGRNIISSRSAYQHKTENLLAISATEEQGIPVMLNEIKMPYRSRMRPRTQEFSSRVPLYRRSQDMGYDSSEHLIHTEFYDRPVHYPPFRYREAESIGTRRHLHRSDISDAVWPGEEFYLHPYSESSGEIYPHPRHPMYNHERRPLVAYSGETIRSGYRVLDSYSHLYPRWSSHLPQPDVSYTRGLYGPRDFDSFTGSPQVFTDSDYHGRSHDSISEDQRTSRMQLRRNLQAAQHLQPVARGAPFITCYQCLELLQLPSDFLPLKGIRTHRVKCSACSSILKFTLKQGCHLVPYVPKLNDPRSEGADKFFNSAANPNNEALHRRSASASIYAGNLHGENASLRSSSHAPERQRSNFESKASEDKGKGILEEMHKHNKEARSSSPDIPKQAAKVTWKLPNRSTSPLHRLMGYSSPSAVYGYDSEDETIPK